MRDGSCREWLSDRDAEGLARDRGRLTCVVGVFYWERGFTDTVL